MGSRLDSVTSSFLCMLPGIHMLSKFIQMHHSQAFSSFFRKIPKYLVVPWETSWRKALSRRPRKTKCSRGDWLCEHRHQGQVQHDDSQISRNDNNVWPWQCQCCNEVCISGHHYLYFAYHIWPCRYRQCRRYYVDNRDSTAVTTKSRVYSYCRNMQNYAHICCALATVQAECEQ